MRRGVRLGVVSWLELVILNEPFAHALPASASCFAVLAIVLMILNEERGCRE